MATRLDWRDEFSALGLGDTVSEMVVEPVEPAGLPPSDPVELSGWLQEHTPHLLGEADLAVEDELVEAAYAVADQVLESYRSHVRSVREWMALNEVANAAAFNVVCQELDAADAERAERAERAQLWRERLPELAEATLNPEPRDERWSEDEIASVADELGVDLDELDTTGISEHGVAEAAWIAGAIKNPGALRRQLGAKPGEPLSVAKIEAAAKAPGTLGRRARLALTLMKLSRRRRGRAGSGGPAKPWPSETT